MDRSFLYKSGEFLPAGDMPVDEDGDIHGYFDTQTVGQINDIHYVLWETNPNSGSVVTLRCRWRAVRSV